MVHRYKKRLNSYILKQMEKPKKVHEYKPPLAHSFRAKYKERDEMYAIMNQVNKEDFLIRDVKASSYLRNDRISYSVYFNSINSKVPI